MGHTVAPGEALLRLFEETDDARALLDADGDVVLVNTAFEQLLGWRREQLVGQSKDLAVPPSLRTAYSRLRSLLVASDSHDAVRLNLRTAHRNGHEVPVRLTARLIHLGDDRLVSLTLQPRSDNERDSGFRELLDALVDGNVIVDGDGHIVMVNEQVEELFGYRQEELVDQPVELLVPEGARATHAAHRHGFTGKARRHTMGMGNRVLGRRKDGSTFPVQVLLSSIGADEGVLISATVRDLTGMEELMAANDRLRGEFIATVSHELRTPLTTIMASSEMLADTIAGVGDAEARRAVEDYVDRIMRAARRELTLVDDLLAVTAIEASEAQVARGLCDLGAVARTAVTHARERAAARDITLEAAGPETPLLVAINEKWLARAIGCVLDNALKFSPEGGHVTIVWESGDLAALEIRDPGPGIPEAEAELVFERLYRGRNAVVAHTSGAGLGLSIARSIVEAADGTLVAVPSPDGGCLRLCLPHAEVGGGEG